MADIGGEPMIVQVWRRAVASNAGPVVVATDSEVVFAAVSQVGGVAVMTRADHPSGSDRIHEAVMAVDPNRHHDVIVNLQGDLPTLDPSLVTACIEPLGNGATDIATLAALIVDPDEANNPNVVKVVGTPLPMRQGAANVLRALYFTRATAPFGPGPLYHHIGIYAYRRAALERFVMLTPSMLEVRERLEQLRALEAGMRIDAAIVATVPLGVDTPADLERARVLLAQ